MQSFENPKLLKARDFNSATRARGQKPATREHQGNCYILICSNKYKEELRFFNANFLLNKPSAHMQGANLVNTFGHILENSGSDSYVIQIDLKVIPSATSRKTEDCFPNFQVRKRHSRYILLQADLFCFVKSILYSPSIVHYIT